MLKLIVLRPNDTQIVDAEKDLLKQLQMLVGGFIEVVHPEGLSSPYLIVVDEEGALKENMQVNPVATFLYNLNSMQTGDIYPIMGVAVMLKEVVDKDDEDFAALTALEAISIMHKLMLI